MGLRNMYWICCDGFEEYVLDLFVEIGYNYLCDGFEEYVLDLLPGLMKLY